MAELAVILLALALLLVAVSLLLGLAERYGLPHTLLLATLGLVLGSASLGYGPLSELAPATVMVESFSRLGLAPEAFLYIFLPPLLFTAGLTIDVRLLIDEIGAVLLLAVVAVVVCTLVVGFALSMALGIALVPCLLLGAIVATTDPAAVVGLFRDIGAPRRLSTLVAGESLFNDAAAIGLFAILIELLTMGREPSISGAVAAFGIDFLGGALFGYFMARAAELVLLYVRDQPIAEITVTLALAYLTFVLGEHYLGVSGVVAVVLASLTFAVTGRIRVSPGSWDSLLQIWLQIEFWANSLIFVLACMLAARVLPNITWGDLYALLLLVAATLAARALVLFGFMPGLTVIKLAQPVGPRYKLMILWGGLRGAVTLALALSVLGNTALTPELQQFVGVLATSYVLFTLFVGGPTLRPLLRATGLDRLSRVDRALRDRIVALSRRKVEERTGEIAHDYGFESALARDYPRLVPVPKTGDDEEQRTKDLGDLTSEELMQLGLLALASHERVLYMQHFVERTVTQGMIGSLLAFADRLMDRVKTAASSGYETQARRAVAPDRFLRGATWVHKNFGLERPLAYALADRFEQLLIQKMVVGELERFNRESLDLLLGEEISQRLAKLLDRRLGLLETSLSAVEQRYPSFASSLKGQYLARVSLRVEDAEYRLHLARALISREVFQDLHHDLQRRRKRVEERPRLDLELDLEAMLRRVPFFADLEGIRLRTISRLLKPRLALPNQRVVVKGARGTAMYFIATGEVEVRLSEGPVKLGPGEFFGEMALLHQRPRVADVVALGYCQLLMLERSEFQRLLRSSADIRKIIEDTARRRAELP